MTNCYSGQTFYLQTPSCGTTCIACGSRPTCIAATGVRVPC